MDAIQADETVKAACCTVCNYLIAGGKLLVIVSTATVSEEICLGVEGALEELRARHHSRCVALERLIFERDALADDVRDLQLIHARCDELRALYEQLCQHEAELRQKIKRADAGCAGPKSLWQAINDKFGKRVSSQELRTNFARELQATIRRRQLCEGEAAQLILEMQAREAFIKHETQDLVARLHLVAPDFPEAQRLHCDERRRVRQLDELLQAVGRARHGSGHAGVNVDPAAPLVIITNDGPPRQKTPGERFDAVFDLSNLQAPQSLTPANLGLTPFLR